MSSDTPTDPTERAAVRAIMSDRDYVAYATQGAGGGVLAPLAARALAAAGLLAAPLDVEDLTARLAAADLGYAHEHGDPPSDPAYIKRLAWQVCAFEPRLAAPAAQQWEIVESYDDHMRRPCWDVTAPGQPRFRFMTREAAELALSTAEPIPAAPAAQPDDEAVIDRVAEGLVGYQHAEHGTVSWSDYDERGKDSYRDMARAALAALRGKQQ